ncbi:PQQ-binding-like beta-propeller repeat protein [Streptomyces sp. NPDC058657]|uniref:outer membrane protein assembly factor BamB family protein n=1 Tax=unclassified Streptomyces TaxID=2593676 RepID=UPI0036637966
MSASPLRVQARSLLVAAVLTLSMSACDASPPARNPTDDKPTEKKVVTISEDPAWTARTSGERFCPKYTGSAVIDAGNSDVTMRNANTGKIKWTHKVGDIACPLVTKEAVYVASDHGWITALDLDSGKEKGAMDTDGISVSMAPVETTSGIHIENTGDIVTVDKSLERKIWQHEEDLDLWADRVGSSGTTVVLLTRNGKAKALSSETGKLVWTYVTPTHARTSGDLTIADGIVYFGSHDGSMYAVNLATGQKAWTTKLEQGSLSTPRLIGNMLITSQGDYIHALDRKTGREQWKHLTAGTVMMQTAAGQVFYSDRENGNVTSLDVSTGERIATLSPVPGASWLAASPTHLYVWTKTEIRAYKFITK